MVEFTLSNSMSQTELDVNSLLSSCDFLLLVDVIGVNWMCVQYNFTGKTQIRMPQNQNWNQCFKCGTAEIGLKQIGKIAVPGTFDS